MLSYKYVGFFVQVYFLGIEENRRVAREHFQSRMRIFTKTRVVPHKDDDAPGDTITTLTSNNISELSLNLRTRRYESGTVGTMNSGIVTFQDSQRQYGPLSDGVCNLNIPDGRVSGE